jgi:hypothetical protein
VTIGRRRELDERHAAVGQAVGARVQHRGGHFDNSRRTPR